MSSLTIRTDPESEAALAYIQQETGADKSRATREALLAQARRLAAKRLREESSALRDDPADRAEMASVAAEMSALNAW
jgi:ATPase subunit of ABC transporter with duplicated ATPase domains